MQRSLMLSILLMLTSSFLPAADDAPETPDFIDENMITHGPILGRLSSTGIGVWARTLQDGPVLRPLRDRPERPESDRRSRSRRRLTMTTPAGFTLPD